MPMARITPMGERNLYHVHFFEGGEHPDHGLPGGGGHPDQGLPGGGGHPSHPIAGRPGGGRPDQGLPGGGGGIPDNSLPSAPPPTLLPGYTLVMVRGPDGKWKYAAVKPGVAPPIVLPDPIPPGGAPDQGLPPQPDQGLPSPTPSPKA
jgi:hypothetical protein